MENDKLMKDIVINNPTPAEIELLHFGYFRESRKYEEHDHAPATDSWRYVICQCYKAPVIEKINDNTIVKMELQDNVSQTTIVVDAEIIFDVQQGAIQINNSCFCLMNYMPFIIGAKN